MTTPTTSARAAIDGGWGETTRRVEVYESDGVSLYKDGLSNRLVDGSVNLTYGDSVRRALDLTLSNQDNALRSNPNGFWYDKVFKLYRGVSIPSAYVSLNAAVIDASTVTAGNNFVAWISRLGLPDSKYFPTVPELKDLLNYDVIVSYAGTAVTPTGSASKLAALFAEGKSVITFSVANTSAQVPHITTTSAKSDDYGISQPVTSTVMSTGWTSAGIAGTVAGTAPSALASGALVVARWQMNDASYAITGSAQTNSKGGRWFDFHLQSFDSGNSAGINTLMANVIEWIKSASQHHDWETQIGEFAIDNISTPRFPNNVKVTGRDYVKKCLNSKIESPMAFDSGTPISTLIRAVAANAGITKFRLTSMLETLGSSMTFDRGTPRWEVIYKAASTQGYEIFFDNEGYLVTRKYLDPTLGFPSNTFQTGIEGNLSDIDRAVNDTRLYNHIAVYGDPSSGETRLPFFAQAKNENPDSPTRIKKIGDRYYSFASTFFTSQLQCQQYADRLLGIHALESFELSFQSICYPWMEVGEIAKAIDPRAVEGDPDQYLVDTVTIPMTLGPMSFTGKRVTIVGG